MAVAVRIPLALRRYTGGATRAEVEGGTVAEVLGALAERFPELGRRLYDGSGALHPFISVFVNGDDIRGGAGLETPVGPADEVLVMPAMAGGS